MNAFFFPGGMPVIRLAAALLLALCLAGAAGSARADTRLMVVSDLHYLDPSLYQGSESFPRVLRSGDGKITQCGEELMSALYREILLERPDALIVTGDLTFNGEKKSHAALADWFHGVEAAGVPVWVIPGNHDINVPDPVGFRDDTYYRTEGTTPGDFAAYYADFAGPGEVNFSYTAKIGGDLWVAMTDVAWYRDRAQTFGVFTSRHAAWMEGVMKSARAEGARVVTATHHSMLAHTEFSKESFLMFGSDAMADLVRTYGAGLNLSGHLHVQHIAREDGIADAALGAFCAWPHRYAMVTLDSGGLLTYEARSLDRALLPEGFPEMSREWFAGITREKVLAFLPGDGEDNRLMADYAARFNLAYFSGTYQREDPAWTEDPAFPLWEKQTDTAFYAYLRLVMNETSGDNLRWSRMTE